MNLKEIYEYSYYKVYKSMDNELFHWGASWRASGLLLGFFVILIISLDLYWAIITTHNLFITGYEIIIPVAVLYVIDHFTFHSKAQWKEIVKKYDTWPRKKNFRGTLIVWGLIALVIANFLIALNLHGRL